MIPPEGIRNQTCECDDRQVPAERGLRCICSQGCAGGECGQLALLLCEQGHRNRCDAQYNDPEKASPHFAVSKQREGRDQNYVGRQCE